MTDFDALYRQYSPNVYRFALSLSGNRAVAEDITSETFVRVWTARERLDLTTVIGYLLTIARRLYLQDVSRERRGESLMADPADRRPSQADLSYEEIAHALGITPGAAKVKVHRARQKLLTLRLARERG